jgi:hypothetical protein
LTEIFEAPNPKKESLKRAKVVLGKNRGVTDVVEVVEA